MIRIDAHQHYWLTARGDYGWLQPSTGRLYADYMPEQLKPLLQAFGIAHTVLVQAAPTVAETEFMLDLAERDDSIAGVVGWLDFESATFEQEWRRLRARPKLAGVRPMIQDLPSDWILREPVLHNLRLLAAEGFAVDLQANPRHLPYIADMLERVPGLRAVVDHLAKPPIGTGTLEPWRSDMERIAAFPDVMCKLSGMVPERTDAPWSEREIRPYAEAAIAMFGKDRVMFGSDWPVCLYAASYADVVGLFEALCGPDWTAEERANVYGGNAIRFYGLSV